MKASTQETELAGIMLRQRLTAVESRLTEVEKRLNLPLAAQPWHSPPVARELVRSGRFTGRVGAAWVEKHFRIPDRRDRECTSRCSKRT